MDLRTRLLLAIGGGVLLIVVIIVSVTLGGKDTEDDVPVPSSEQVIPSEDATPTSASEEEVNVVVGQVPVIPAPIPVTTAEKEALYVRQVARDFTERFLSFSNKNDNKHLSDIESLVTATMWDWAKNQTVDPTQAVSSQTTKVVSTNVIRIEGDSASVQIGAQQQVQSGTEIKTVYKRGRIDLMRIGGIWKVDGLFWE